MRLTWGFHEIKMLRTLVYYFSQNLFSLISKHSDVQILKILTVWTLKNSQSSVTLKNECKQLGYYFPNEIKNSTHSNERNFQTKTTSKV